MRKIEQTDARRLIRYCFAAVILIILLQLLVSRSYPSFWETLSYPRPRPFLPNPSPPSVVIATLPPSQPSPPPQPLPRPQSEQGNSSPASCPEQPPGLLGDKFPVPTDADRAPSWMELETALPDVRHGGCQPDSCVARQRVAIIVPYRNRDAHLRLLLSILHPMLRRQQLNYRIFVIEQAGSTRFNRAMLFNIGFVEASKIFPADCYIFHDVDLLPEHDHNIYRCGRMPRHLSAAVDKFGYNLPYETIFGGACSLTGEQFRTVNGFSNVFFGWGGEDDDFRNRVTWAGYQVSRYPMSVARYKMIKHNRDKKNDPNPQRMNLISQGRKRWKEDGLSSLQYSLVGVQDRQVVYFISVEIPEAQVLSKFHLS